MVLGKKVAIFDWEISAPRDAQKIPWRPLKNRQYKGIKYKWWLSEGRKYCRMLSCVFCNTFDLHVAIISLENQFLVFFLSGCLRQVLLYLI